MENQPVSVQVGEWVISSALKQLEIWNAAGLDLEMSVNVGAHQLLQGNFTQRVSRLLAEHPRVRPSKLTLEILETSALGDTEQVSRLIRSCQAMGIGFALDDFGTGYSSLTYLKHLPAETLKIDRSFVRDMLTDRDDLAIVKGVIALARAFKRKVIAEGVETQAHMQRLRRLGCEGAQGFGIARAMPANEVPGWLAAWSAQAAKT
jgi:EAL domain-containing protein (putative c-di-GMP-specific phosphodiesterase class I)